LATEAGPRSEHGRKNRVFALFADKARRIDYLDQRSKVNELEARSALR
jgi:hypothetical protein